MVNASDTDNASLTRMDTYASVSLSPFSNTRYFSDRESHLQSEIIVPGTFVPPKRTFLFVNREQHRSQKAWEIDINRDSCVRAQERKRGTIDTAENLSLYIVHCNYNLYLLVIDTLIGRLLLLAASVSQAQIRRNRCGNISAVFASYLCHMCTTPLIILLILLTVIVLCASTIAYRPIKTILVDCSERAIFLATLTHIFSLSFIYTISRNSLFVTRKRLVTHV